MIKLHFGFKGIVTIDKGKLDKNGNSISREHVSKFDNLILDTGLHQIALSDSWLDMLHLGSGITPPHPLQFSLVNPTYEGRNLAPVPNTDIGIDTSDPQNPYTWITRIFRVLPQGVNRTYTELGIGGDSNNLFSRTLIKDYQGNPKSITVLGDEYLDIKYECRMYIPADTIEYSITPTGSDNQKRTVTVRAAMIDTLSRSYGWALGYPYGKDGTYDVYKLNSLCGSVNKPFVQNILYDGGLRGLEQRPDGRVVGEHFNYTTMVRIDAVTMQFSFVRGLSDNVGTIRSILISQTGYCFQMEIDPPLVKTEKDKFYFTYQITWGRR